MAAKRENVSKSNGLGALRMRAYNIAGNKIRAFFDASDKLVFVIDDTVTPDKPNALLVINSDDDRKWDEILAKDYGVSLEMVRPKKDNKYQKLDIEYIGLDEYGDLIADFEEGADIEDSLAALNIFREDASRQAATDRLRAADAAAENARETIAKARDSISELGGRIKTLKTRLGQQRKDVGREPTKQSAAKILRTESQIDALKEKQRRAERRLENARRRLVSAEEDAGIAREILARGANAVAAPVPAVVGERAVAPVRNTSDLPVAVAPVQDFADMEPKQITAQQSEQKAKNMAEEVKPLFEKDPEILDEEIAFKPIDFSVTPTVAPADNAMPRFDDAAETVAPAPLSFVPPINADMDSDATQMARTTPVLDTITSVEIPEQFVDQAVPSQNVAPQNMAEPFVMPAPTPIISGADENTARPAPVSPAVPGGAPAAAVRPVSPVTGMPASDVVRGGDTGGRRPTFMYYVLLIALIVLSIFTLWLYQKKNNDTVPDLAATVTTQQKDAPEKTSETEAPSESPFIVTQQESVVIEEPVAPAPVVQEMPEPEPIAQEPAAPVVDETVPAIPVVAEPAVVQMPEETPFLTEPEPEPEPVKPVVVNKPAYNAGSQNENMFVADAGYDTEKVSAQEPAPVVYEDTTIVQESVGSGLVCDDGGTPDVNGCCGDERYTDTGDGTYACCSASSGECYEPMF